jgi:Ser/Thr protein kinase RdoA (MazF antagonist)
MKPYNDLSMAGKLRRLRDLAVAALARYELDSPELAYHGFETNLLYRVTTASGERFMLRLATPGWRTFEDLQSEALWLDALRRETTLSVPRIVPARSGEYVLPMSRPGVPRIWNTSLMNWVPGRSLRHYLSERNLEKMGALFAELHLHAASWTPPIGFTTRRFEHWLSRGEENLIVDGQQSVDMTAQPDSVSAMPSCTRDLLDRLHRHVESAYATIDRSDLRVIHCDLWHDNIKVYRGVLHPLDFEDTVWGFRVHDIAMAMLDLLEDTDETRYARLLAAFRCGYQVHEAWPDDPMEPFQIGRLLWKINWVARRQPEWLMSTIERHIPLFEHYERSGRVLRPPAG